MLASRRARFEVLLLISSDDENPRPRPKQQCLFLTSLFAPFAPTLLNLKPRSLLSSSSKTPKHQNNNKTTNKSSNRPTNILVYHYVKRTFLGGIDHRMFERGNWILLVSLHVSRWGLILPIALFLSICFVFLSFFLSLLSFLEVLSARALGFGCWDGSGCRIGRLLVR